jgi:hypothetical protein
MKTGALDRYVDRLVRNKASAQCLETIEMQRAGKLVMKQFNQVGADPILNVDGTIAVDETALDGSPNFRQQCVIDSYDKLLLHLDNNVTDSATGKTVTNNNVTFDASIKKFGTHSAVFNGTNSYLQLADSDDWRLGGGCFTIDFWYRIPTGSIGKYFEVHQYVDANNYWACYIYLNGEVGFRVFSGGVSITYFITSAYTIAADTWYHFAIVRDGSNAYVFINGVSQVPTVTNLGIAPDFAAPLRLGEHGSGLGYWFNGYIDELRIVKGVARWTSNFTPPAQPYPCIGSVNSKGVVAERVPKKVGVVVKLDQNDATVTASVARDVDNYTKLLMHGECFKDETGKAVTFYGNALIDSSVYKFAGGSMKFDTSSSYLSIPNSSDWYLGVGDWTIDFWIRLNSNPPSGKVWGIVQQRTSDNTMIHIVYGVPATTGEIGLTIWNSGVASSNWTSGAGMVINTWYHVAVVRYGSYYITFINGVQYYNAVNSMVWGVYTGNLTIGYARNETPEDRYLDGYLDEVRISKGIARWTANFTPLTARYELGNYVSAPLTQMGSTGYYRSDLIDVSAQPSGQCAGAKVNFYSSVAKVQGIGVYYR